MPTKSPAQKRLMQAAAHTKGGFGGVPQKVGKDFVSADKRKTKKMAEGGVASLGGMLSSTPSSPAGQSSSINPPPMMAQGGGREDLPSAPVNPVDNTQPVNYKKGGRISKKMNDGGKVNFSGINKVDPLRRRIGANIVHKFPREGQTNFRDIPFGNHPESPNAKRPETIASMEKERAQRPEIIKKFIKEDLGNHREPVLPKAKGGHITTRRLSSVTRSKNAPSW